MQIGTLEGMKTRRNLLRVVCGLCCALFLGFVGCGSSDSNAGPARGDNTADFAFLSDPSNANVLLIPGQPTQFALDLVSLNGFPHPITLTVGNGQGVTIVTPTVPSLPKGTTKVLFNVTIPVGTLPALNGRVGDFSATGGGLTRYLNANRFGVRGGSGGFVLPIAGLGVKPTTAFTPFPFPLAFTAGDVTGSPTLVGVNLTGPVTVTLANSYPGITATLGKSVFTPTGPKASIEEAIPISVHIDASVAAGTYPFLITATASDGTKATFTANLYILSMAFVGSPPTITVGNQQDSIATAEVDLTIVGPPLSFAILEFNVDHPQPNIQVTITPGRVPFQTSGTFTQHISIEVHLSGGTARATYNVDLRGNILGTSGTMHAPFTLIVQ